MNEEKNETLTTLITDIEEALALKDITIESLQKEILSLKRELHQKDARITFLQAEARVAREQRNQPEAWY